MRISTLPLIGLLTIAIACGKKTDPTKSEPSKVNPPPAAPAANPKADSHPVKAEPPSGPAKQTFEASLRADRVQWEPVKNLQLTTKTNAGSQVQSFDFRTRIKYDSNGKGSVDKTGWATYTWPTREAVFGPGAVIRISSAIAVVESDIPAGELWIWDGSAWLSKKQFDDRLAKLEAVVLKELGASAVASVVRDPNATDDPSLAGVYAKLSEKPGDVKAKFAACLNEKTSIPAVLILKEPQAVADMEKKLGRATDKQDQTMLFPTGDGTVQGRPVMWYRYGRIDVGTELDKPAIIAIRVWSTDF